MGPQNLTRVSEFLLLGLSEDPELQPLLFGMFLSMYMVTVLGNLLIIFTVSSDPQLHNPMYFFISILSIADIGLISDTIPKMLINLYTHHRIITYADCLIQLCFLIFFGSMDNLLLMVMAYDRFVAICHPLHYPIIMNPYFCGLLVWVSIFLSVLESQLHYLMMSLLTFCTEMEIPHFFCDPSQLLNLACSKTTTKNILVYFIAAIFGGVPISGILFSYTRIISSILKIPSSSGKHKAFSTCVSHFSVVSLFYGTGIGVYLSSVVSPSLKSGAAVSVMYSVVTPMLNPFIYSLRNKDIKRAMQRLIKRPA
ncbi:PREDICTED: olfactory receptor 18-like [Chrysochloris asiatica]|uniref:Olfactory receptor n=1 Tax=Chrysochloris asiatica TaxID=185453 RepID=A0A9B0UEP6_CHRAS|nr:PREDICTED: olfactory receptor 18-like [Chrysochloris asiatica]